MLGEEEDLKKQNGIMNDARRRRRHEAQKLEKREQNVPEIWTLLSQLRRNSRNPRLAVLFFFFLQSYGRRLQGDPESKCFFCKGGGRGKVAMIHRKI
jgi:hypothetical protein